MVLFLGGKLTDIKGDFYEYHKETTIVDEWGVLATAKADDHDQYLNMIPQECKDQVKDYFKNKSKKWIFFTFIERKCRRFLVRVS